MIIAERILYASTPGAESPVPVRLFAPHEFEPFHWACDFEIGWPEGVRRFTGHGIDAVQAIWIALQVIGIELYVSDWHKRGALRSEGQNGGYGFPIAANCRHLLVGDDRLEN